MRSVILKLVVISLIVFGASGNALAATKKKAPTLKGVYSGLLSFIGTSCDTIPNATAITFGMQIIPAGNKAIVQGPFVGQIMAKRNKNTGALTGKVSGLIDILLTREDKIEINPKKNGKSGSMKVSFSYFDQLTNQACFDTFKGTFEKQ